MLHQFQTDLHSKQVADNQSYTLVIAQCDRNRTCVEVPVGEENVCVLSRAAWICLVNCVLLDAKK